MADEPRGGKPTEAREGGSGAGAGPDGGKLRTQEQRSDGRRSSLFRLESPDREDA